MRKARTYIFLGALTLVFLIGGYYLLSGGSKENKVEVIIETTDSLVNKVNPSQFKKAYKYMDSCLVKNDELTDNKEFKERYDRLKQINQIL